MRRTTICRSSLLRLALAVGVGSVGAPLSAQQVPPSPPPAQQQQQQAGAPPATHVVQQGETLWSLAQQYFGDPLLWPEIYRLNTNVIEDPHWIFPGEELRLVPLPEQAQPGGGNVTVTPGSDTAQAQAEVIRLSPQQTIFSAPALVQQRQQASLELRAEQAYRAVREGEYFSAGFLAEARSLPAGRLLGNAETSSIRRLSARTTAMLFSAVVARPPTDEAYHRGDRLLAYTVDRAIRGYGDVIVPTGLLNVTSGGEAGQNVNAEVVALYGQITDGQSLLKMEPFTYNSNARPVPTDSGVEGEVVALRSEREVVARQDVLFINRGAEDGVRLGDIFQISSTAGARSGIGSVVQSQGRVMVVHTRPHTASAIVLELDRPDIRPGATARQIRRMPPS